MLLDGMTVFFDATLVSMTVGALMVYCGTSRRGDPSLRLWGFGNLVASVSLYLLSQRGILSDTWTIGVANALIALSYGLFWSSARQFERKPVEYALVALGPAIWLGACLFDVFMASPAARLILSSLIVVTYLGLTSWVIYKIPQKLPSRKALIVVMVVHGLFYAARIPALTLAPPQTGANLVLSPFVIAVAVEALIHLVASSVLMLLLARERSDLIVRELASIDSLTSLLNRRTFMEQASLILDQAHRSKQPCTVLMIDVDHFKRINDQYGHEGGDVVLKDIARAIGEKLRRSDLFGRIGGEEFACVLPNCPSVQSQALAERLMESVATINPCVTISIGAASTDLFPNADIETMLRPADEALYRSKNEGRNRVTVARPAAA
jgi:diguanylate cyclase (GGDEF)-like protein